MFHENLAEGNFPRIHRSYARHVYWNKVKRTIRFICFFASHWHLWPSRDKIRFSCKFHASIIPRKLTRWLTNERFSTLYRNSICQNYLNQLDPLWKFSIVQCRFITILFKFRQVCLNLISFDLIFIRVPMVSQTVIMKYD